MNLPGIKLMGALAIAGCLLAVPLRADPTLPTIPAAIFKVTAYGAVADGVTDNTVAIQNAIRAAQSAGGGTVELTAASSSYLCGPITVGSNINLQIDSGATLQLLPYGAGTNAPGTYPLSGTAYVNFLSITGNNVALTGGGTIEGNGAAWWAAFNADNNIPHRPYMIRFNNSNFVLIKNLTLRNSPMFHVAFGATNNVTVDSITIFSPTTSVNTDGVDPSGQHYLIKNCNISTGDDDVCLKPESSLCADITITDCAFGTGHGVSVGGQTNDGLDGMAVINCTFTGTTNGLRLKADPTEGGLVQNITYSNLTMTDVQYPIVFYSYYDQVGNPGAIGGTNQATAAEAASWNAIPPNTAYRSYATTTMPTWRNITINNLTATRTTNGADGFSVIWGLPNIPMANITLNNVRFSGYSGFVIFNAQNIRFTGGTSIPGLLNYNAQIVTLPAASQAVALGGTANFSAGIPVTTGANGAIVPTIQWSFNGRALIDGPRADGSIVNGSATGSLTVANAQPGETGFYTATTTAALDTFKTGLVPGGVSAVATANAALAVGNAADVGRLVNLSARANVGLGANNLVIGFVLGGAGTDSTPKKVLLRGIGPGLAAFGVSGTLVDPALQVANASTAAVVATNDNWAGDPAVVATASQVGAFPLASASSLDAALVTSLAPANYTANLSGAAGGTGVALLEVYDAATASPATAPRLINVSARAFVSAGAGALAAGFVISGSVAKTVLIRGVGPALAQFGLATALADPVLQVYGAGSSVLVATNDDWGGDPAIAAAAARVGAFALNDPASKDAALLVTLPPGNYTANLTSATTATGIALVEVYEVP